ncbi:MAG: FecR domain-containing protein [Elusimicrobiota bacterium]
MNPLKSLAAAVVASLAASASAQVPGLTPIGAAAAVRGRVEAFAPVPANGKPVGRIVSSGKPMYLNDHVTTDKGGRLQVLLADETTFTLGPNSDMVLDEFVYDPRTNAGKITANIAKGTFRFVTGKLAHQDPAGMKIKLAVGTIGIRGSVGAGETGPEGSVIINAGAGDGNDNGDFTAGIYAANNGRTTNLRRPGSGAEIRPGMPPSSAADYSKKLDEIMKTLGATVGQAENEGPQDIEGISGREAAKGLDLSAIARDFQGFSKTQTTIVDQVAEESEFAVPNGPTSWDFIRSNVTMGTGFYLGTGSVACTGAGCANGPTSMRLVLQYDFGARTYGGPCSCLSLTNSAGALTDMYMLNKAVPFPTSGPAKIALSGSSIGKGGDFTGTTISLANMGGVVAKQAVVNLVYANSSTGVTSATGNMAATR